MSSDDHNDNNPNDNSFCSLDPNYNAIRPSARSSLTSSTSTNTPIRMRNNTVSTSPSPHKAGHYHHHQQQQNHQDNYNDCSMNASTSTSYSRRHSAEEALLSPVSRASVILSSTTRNSIAATTTASLTPTTSTSIVSPTKRRSSQRYDVTHAMDRLRSTFLNQDLTERDDDDDNDVFTLPFLPNLQQQQQNEEEKKENENEKNQLPPSLQSSFHKNDNMNRTKRGRSSWINTCYTALHQIPAIILIGMFHLMIGIPFGVSYFPVGWRSDYNTIIDDVANSTLIITTDSDDNNMVDDGILGPFPLPGKEALGIRMFLFSTIIGQIFFTLYSNFNNPIGLQMVENVPFCHELAVICIIHQGYTLEALTTLFVLFGFASIIVGIAFYLLGKFELGRIVYFFPMHVLVGCIGGIGVYISKTGLEVTMDASISSYENIIDKWHLLRVTFLLEIILRILERVTLDAQGRPKFALLSPIYFCMITPIFYVALWIFHVPLEDANAAGYFFPPIATAASEATTNDGAATIPSTMWSSWLQDDHIWDMWKVLDLRKVSMPAMLEAIPTLIALTLFSLIHVPINIVSFPTIFD